jgi:hypothetical protein
MKILVGALLSLLATACIATNNGYNNPPPDPGFTADYAGRVSENYNCSSLGTSPTFIVDPDHIHLDVDGAGNANIYFDSCPNDVFTGYESVDGSYININTTTAYSCQQDTGQDHIDITQISGRINYYGSGITLELGEFAIINGDTCNGTAQGTLY